MLFRRNLRTFGFHQPRENPACMVATRVADDIDLRPQRVFTESDLLLFKNSPVLDEGIIEPVS